MRILEQEINTKVLRDALKEDCGWSDRDKRMIEAILSEGEGGYLSVEYRRKDAGRWYAKGRAQLQNCKKQIRSRALKGMGYSIDLGAAFPSILVGIGSEIAKTRATRMETIEIQRMIQDITAWRSHRASELGTSTAKVKRGVNAILFGMKYSKWRRSAQVDDGKRSIHFERLEKEVMKARTLIADMEVREGRASASMKDTKILSKTVEKIEEEITGFLSCRLAESGWRTSTLIHDELIIKPSQCFTNHSDELTMLTHGSTTALRIFEESRGWPPGTLAMKISSL